MENCIFCKIAKGEIPSEKVYENEDFLAFLDIQPVADGHLLLIPKKHVVWLQEAEDKTIEDIFKLAKKLMLSIKKGIGCDYVQLSVVGKDVPHFHIHLIPRHYDDHFAMLPTKTYKDKESTEAAQKIISAL